MKKNLLKLMFAILFVGASMFIASAEEYLIPSGDCKDFIFEGAIFNNETNETEWFNQTERFCAGDVDNIGACQIRNKVLNVGEDFVYSEGSCDLDISCDTNISFYDVEFPWNIYKSINDDITVDMGHDFTQTFDISSPEIQFSGIEIFQCPVGGLNLEESNLPEDIFECLTIIKDQQKEDRLCPGELEACNGFLVEQTSEVGSRGILLESCNEGKTEQRGNLDNCKVDVAKQSGAVTLLMIMSTFSIGAWIVFGLFKLVARVRMGPDLG